MKKQRDILPRNLILRCYAHRTEKGNLVGVCIDLDICVEASTEAELKRKMSDAISSYLESVLDTEDPASVPDLLVRRAPLRDLAIYYLIKILPLTPRAHAV